MKFIMLLITAFITANAYAIENSTIRVTADRVSMRIGPSIDANLADRAMRDQQLQSFETNNGWVSVQAPSDTSFWVYGKHVQDGIVQPDTLYVRSAPKRLKANHVCAVHKGDVVSEREVVNGWIKIAAPSHCRLWISSNYVEKIGDTAISTAAPVAVLVPALAPAPMLDTLAPSIGVLASVSLVADNSKPQGYNDQASGILRRHKPGLYKLVQKMNGSEQAICLISGEQSQIDRYLNHAMQISGKKFWARDEVLPLIHMDSIKLGSNSKG